MRKRLDVEGVEVQQMSPEALTEFVASENTKWGPIARRRDTPRLMHIRTFTAV